MPKWILSSMAVALLWPALLHGQDSLQIHQPGVMPDTTRIGLMSPMVVQQRLRMLGHNRISVVQTERSVVYANTVKDGRRLGVRLDVFSGRLVEQPGRLELRPQGLRLIKPTGVEAPAPGNPAHDSGPARPAPH
jgi:hypothetical protein